MSKASEKKSRILDIFYRAFRGESISVSKLANEYSVTTKSISRDINEIKNFLSDNRELVGNTELVYNFKTRTYELNFDGFLLSKELTAILKTLIGTRAFSKEELVEIISKLRQFTSVKDRETMSELIKKEMYHYKAVGSDCDSVIENLWTLTTAVRENKEISITYIKMNRAEVVHRIKPLAVSFSEHYFYLFAEDSNPNKPSPIYFRVDRIKKIVIHRDHIINRNFVKFDEGLLQKRIQYMFPGEEMKIQFEFTGPSVQAILDQMPTAEVVYKEDGKYIIEALVYGDGIKMYLLSQGSWIKVISPPEFVEVMRKEVDKLKENYK